MNNKNDELHVILLAPINAVGGIATWTKYLLKYTNPENVKYHVIDTTKRYDSLGTKLRFCGAFLGLRDSVVRFFKLVKCIRKVHPDLVWITASPSIGLVVRDAPLMLCLRMSRISAIAHLRGGNLSWFFGGFFLRRLLVRSGLRSCRAVFVITRKVEDVARKVLDENKVIYVPNMIDDTRTNNLEDKTIYSVRDNVPLKLAHIAWQAEEKGSLDLVSAMKHVQTNVDCDLVGTVGDKNRKLIETHISELGVGNKIRLVGVKTGIDLNKMFEKADLFVFPTHLEGPEGFPNVILEAMAYGLPIIASDVGNIREMIGADTATPAGELLKEVDPINPQELSEAIDRLILDQKRRKEFSQNGRDRVKTLYLASRIVPKLERLLKNLTDRYYIQNEL